MADWQKFLDLIQERQWGLRWNEKSVPVRKDAAELWTDDYATLALMVGAGVQINVRPSRPGGDLDFDFDIREIKAEAEASALSDRVDDTQTLLPGDPVPAMPPCGLRQFDEARLTSLLSGLCAAPPLPAENRGCDDFVSLHS